jgi:hypothetical protein
MRFEGRIGTTDLHESFSFASYMLVSIQRTNTAYSTNGVLNDQNPSQNLRRPYPA